MCEIKLKEPTDGSSKIPEGGEGGGGEGRSSQRSAASQQQNLTRASSTAKKEQSPAQLRSELWQPQAYPGCAVSWQRFRGRLSVFQHYFLKVIRCFDFKARLWMPWFRRRGKNSSFALNTSDIPAYALVFSFLHSHVLISAIITRF